MDARGALTPRRSKGARGFSPLKVMKSKDKRAMKKAKGGSDG
jgi:hypothetical protein